MLKDIKMKADELMTADELLHKYFDVLAVEQLSSETCVLLNQFREKILSIDKNEMYVVWREMMKLDNSELEKLTLLSTQLFFETQLSICEIKYTPTFAEAIIQELLVLLYHYWVSSKKPSESMILALLEAPKPIFYASYRIFHDFLAIIESIKTYQNFSVSTFTQLKLFNDRYKQTTAYIQFSERNRFSYLELKLNAFVIQYELLQKYFGKNSNAQILKPETYILLNNFAEEMINNYQKHIFPPLSTLQSLQNIQALEDDEFHALIVYWTEFFIEAELASAKNSIYGGWMIIDDLLIALYRNKKAANESIIMNILAVFNPEVLLYSSKNSVFKYFIVLLEKFKKKNGFNAILLAKLTDWYKKYQLFDFSKGGYETRKNHEQIELRIKELLVSPVEDAPIVLPFDDKIGEHSVFYQLNAAQLHSATWPRLIKIDIDKMAINQQQAWAKLWAYAVTADGGSPSKKWLTQGQALIQNTEDFATIAQKWLDCILDDIKHNDVDLSNAFSENNKQAVKGFIWLCSCANSDIFASVLGGLANFGYSKAYGVGARAPAVANAALYTLGQIGAQGVVQLSKLRSKVKFKTGLKLIEKALTEAATRQGISADDLEELSVPKMGFNQNYSKTVDWGSEYTASIMLTGSKKVEIQWFNKSNHQALKNIPSSIKTDYRTQFKELQKQLADIQDIITGQTKRFEDSYLAKRQWKFTDWQQRLIQHDLLSWLATRLIWVFEHNGQTQHGFYLFGQLVNAQNQLIQVDEQSIVSLWHPVYSTVEEVQQWRTLISQEQIIQPFKQAYREVYLITPAEIETGNYSNRFAGHVLKQHQFAALAKDRAWTYRLQGNFDGFNSPNKFIPAWNMGVTLNLDYTQENQLTTDTGLYQYIHTTKVTFWQDRFSLDLINVPAIIFSEMMRDIDLFVGVTSIGTEATTDLYAHHQYTDYIDAFSKAELSARAVVRQEVLANIISKLAIAPRCHFDNKHLIVKGDLRTYKIHLGSSNILMEPNDQYLCIVPSSKQKQASTEGLYLPFEGDLMLSVILSKALLLAADKKIKDQSILAQINRP